MGILEPRGSVPVAVIFAQTAIELRPLQWDRLIGPVEDSLYLLILAAVLGYLLIAFLGL